MNEWAIHDAIARNAGRIAFQLSGGRDSVAALYLLRPFWDRMRVYHLDTGDQFPEVRAVVQAVARDVEIQTIVTDVAAVRERDGMPSDLVPVDNLPAGRVLTGETLKVTTRFACCWNALMMPLHQRMLQDGITLVVRGQRDDEFKTVHPIRSGYLEGTLELLYPIQHWTAAQVDAYIAEHNLPVAAFYAHGMQQAPECMGCTAWWNEGRVGYMQQFHPEAHAKYQQNIQRLRAAIDRQYQQLVKE